MPPRRELKDMEALVEEILKRLPPDEPKHLLHASLVCKHWYSLLSGDGFRSRYRAFHKTPPMLGFFHTLYWQSEFISTIGSKSILPDAPDRRHRYSFEDCCHGRVLLKYYDEKQPYLVVWDPMTGSTTTLREPWRGEGHWGVDRAAVLCAAVGCDHRDCHLDSFLVVSLSFDQTEGVATASAYSLKTGNWSSPATLVDLGYEFDPQETVISPMPSVLAGGALYFPFTGEAFAWIFKYDLCRSVLSKINMPLEVWNTGDEYVLVAAEDGRLGVARLVDFELSVWWMEVSQDQVTVWTQPIVIDLKNHLPIGDNPETLVELVGAMEGTDIVFAVTDLGIYMIDFMSLTSKKISSELNRRDDLWALFPYLGFYIPPEQVHDSGEQDYGSSHEESEETEFGSHEESEETEFGSHEESENLEARTSDEEAGESDAGHGNDDA